MPNPTLSGPRGQSPEDLERERSVSRTHPELYESLVALCDFRNHVLRYAKKWDMEGGTHHHPMWQRIAELLDKYGMND